MIVTPCCFKSKPAWRLNEDPSVRYKRGCATCAISAICSKHMYGNIHLIYCSPSCSESNTKTVKTRRIDLQDRKDTPALTAAHLSCSGQHLPIRRKGPWHCRDFQNGAGRRPEDIKIKCAMAKFLVWEVAIPEHLWYLCMYEATRIQ